MSLVDVKNDVPEVNRDKKPYYGWVADENGWYYAPDDFAQSTAFLTEDFEKFCEQSRSRWSFFEFLRQKFFKTE